MNTIDLRSDTVTWPTDAMRRAMADAEVGDDVYGEDPTVNALQEQAADLFGMEAGLLVTSGTQGNLAALLAHCPRGSEAIIGDKAHTFLYEAGGMAALGGIQPRTIPVQADGNLALDDIQRAIRPDNVHFPRTRLISIENTQGTVGGVSLSEAYTREVAAIARANDLAFHIDGARIFNAAVDQGVAVADMVAGADSVSICLSKGLCAPVGSILVGSAPFIREAHRARKLLGGGLRQAGVLAAAGRIALTTMAARLHEDHATAAALAEALRAIAGLTVTSQHTNFVFFELDTGNTVTPEEFTTRLAEDHNIIMRPYPGYRHTFRCVTHYWIRPEQIPVIADAVRQVLHGG
jgi:threonine aldolase